MSAPMLTSEAQLRYLLQWFGEFSELQRDDFLPVLAAARGDKPEQLAATLATLSCQDKPVSLFQCRIKLFNEWFPTLSEEQQDRLIKGVTEMDPEFGAKLQDIIINGPTVNGDDFGINADNFPVSPRSNDNEEQWSNENVEDNEEDQEVPQNNIPVEIAAAS